MTMAFILIILIPLAVLAALLVVRDRRQRRRHAGDADMVDAHMDAQIRAARADTQLKSRLIGSDGFDPPRGMLTRSPCAWPLDANYRRAPVQLLEFQRRSTPRMVDVGGRPGGLLYSAAVRLPVGRVTVRITNQTRTWF
jgi:hypothetical protein